MLKVTKNFEPPKNNLIRLRVFEAWVHLAHISLFFFFLVFLYLHVSLLATAL